MTDRVVATRLAAHSAEPDVGAALATFLRALRAVKARHAAGTAVDLTAYPLLQVLHDGGAQRANWLAERVHSDPSTVSRQVAHLVDLGYLERVADPSDKRAALLEVTAEGRTALAEHLRQREAYLAELLSGWPERDRRQLARLLARFAAALEDQLDPAAAACPRPSVNPIEETA